MSSIPERGSFRGSSFELAFAMKKSSNVEGELGEKQIDSSLKKEINGSTNWSQLVQGKDSNSDQTKMARKAPRKVKAREGAEEISMFSIFKYADSRDVVLMILGTLGAIGDGLASPAAMILCSGLINTFGSTRDLIATDPAAFERKINIYVLRFVYLALVIGFLCFLEASCWMTTGERQTSRLRSMYLKAMLRQDESFFDTAGANTAEVIDSVSVDTLAIQEAISEKVGNFTANVSTFVGGFIVSVYLVWRVAVILLAFSPLLIIPGIMYGRILANLARKKLATSVLAGTVAEQAISSIRTVYSFVGEGETLERYSQALNANVKLGLKMGLAKSFAVGSNGIIFALWGFMSWYSSILVIDKGVNGGKVICAGLASIAGGLALGTALANVKYFAEGRSAASRIFAMLDRVPAIDSENLSGRVLSSVSGIVELRSVDFAYPSRPDIQIFKNFNLHIPAGTTMALVGSSGSGKSTVVALIERFYDPLSGKVLIDGVDIKDLQVKWFRKQIGLVSQEPALFATTVIENIMYGKDGASEEEVIRAAKAANAHSFISTLPKGYHTQVGERGVQMSGGQKQRIAIARAILKNPPILLLDEATSALDAESEAVVQAALESASVGRTTVIVAHRLSTIRRADSISVVSDGKIVETGSHKELLSVEGGAYAALVRLQESTKDKEDDVPQRGSISDNEIQGMGYRSDSRNGRLSSRSMRLSKRSSKLSGELVELDDPKYLDDPQLKAPPLSRLFGMNRPEWKQAIVGSTGAVAFGIIHPSYAFILGSMVSILYYTDHDKLRKKVDRFALIYVGIAIASFVVNFMQHYSFAAMGELLTKRIQLTMLSKIFTFEVGWFDRSENSSGAVCSRLASEATVGRSLVGDRISLLVQTTGAIGFAFVLALVVSWRLAVVMIATQPLVILCYYARKMLLRKMYNLTIEDQEAGIQVASEAVVNHRTISAFSSQTKVMDLFVRIMDDSERGTQKRSLIAGFGLGIAQAAMYGTWALDFWWGGKLISEGKLTFGDLFKVFFILISAGRMVADAGSMTTDLAKGSSSIVKVFKIIDRETQITPDDPSAIVLDKVEGHVQLRDVDFAYPSRPDVKVFKNFNLRVRAGKTVALVGQSGSGKSTIIGLIERYYDPLRGTVLIDGYDLRTLHLRSVRMHVALVSQEPTLFAGTIRENILYGRKNATEAEMIEASKAANAYNFISAMKDGFDTQTGERGVQLSGGQKQRIAIARAVITNPAILLLDEATSALDSQSEKVVQEALDRIMIGRTTIVVAHRLSTIRNCETIAVLQDGQVLEQGSHDQLMSKGEGGAFYSLVQMQSRTKDAA